MRAYLIILVFFTGILTSLSQDRILYNLDTYKRVDINLRSTFFSPDFSFFYNNTINNQSQPKNYTFNLGGNYNDSRLINNEKNQKRKYQSLAVDFLAGSNESFDVNYNYQMENRFYDDGKYFKSGVNLRSNISYNEDINLFSSYSHFLNVEYDIGFGFGRLEVVNNAWIGARILEELDSKKLLNSIPKAEEMKLFFDHIGDLQFERVMDSRIKSMYIIENIIEFIERKGWIDKGSIKAFVIIYDAFRYEDFFIRQSGERLEFTLTSMLRASYVWRNNSLFGQTKYLQPGYEGNIEYEIHKNGDIEYYQIKKLGGRITHYQRFEEGKNRESKTFGADLYFQYEYKYIPSLRTNFSLATSFSGGLVYNNSVDSRIAISSSLTYNYYFTPSTQLVLQGGVSYDDNRFQIGDYQPNIVGMLSFDIVHAIR